MFTFHFYVVGFELEFCASFQSANCCYRLFGPCLSCIICSIVKVKVWNKEENCFLIEISLQNCKRSPWSHSVLHHVYSFHSPKKHSSNRYDVRCGFFFSLSFSIRSYVCVFDDRAVSYGVQNVHIIHNGLKTTEDNIHRFQRLSLLK